VRTLRKLREISNRTNLDQSELGNPVQLVPLILNFNPPPPKSPHPLINVPLPKSLAVASEIINPIYPEYLPRLTKEFIDLYNENAATKLASHQVPIEEVSTRAKN
jgi:hypothetical protein